ncbi:hypothetical protein MTO96_041871 [Rhipicephalus appendiculatus]
MRLLQLAAFLTFAGFCTSKNAKEPHRCHEEHNTGNCTAVSKNWFYNTSSKRCTALSSRSCNAGTQYFSNISDCNRHCRDRIYGVCAMKPHRKRCYRQELKVRFNPDNQTCEWYATGCYKEENSFKDMNECYDKCGEFVTNPCVLPIRAVSEEEFFYNRMDQFRYGYDRHTRKCVKFPWSRNHGNINSFISRIECLRTCAPKSQCLLYTEHHYWRFFTSFFYDYRHDTCNQTSTYFQKTDYWPNGNRFDTLKSCHDECMPDLWSLPWKVYSYA